VTSGIAIQLFDVTFGTSSKRSTGRFKQLLNR